MKPIRLTMQAFGPYKNKEVIDFARLHEERLFVISGQTGAGKTSIFDALTFALYGLPSGQDRKDNKSLRSDFAQDDVHTSIELIFEVRGATYRVKRQLAHVKKGRKTATGEDYAFVRIEEDGREEVACERQKVKDINEKIEQLIGLTYDQFSQIIMLPQGEFRKLLTSQSDNKEAILRKIFKTERFGEIAKKLEEKKVKADALRKEAIVKSDTYKEQLIGALPRRESKLFSALDEGANLYQIDEALQEEVSHYTEEVGRHELSLQQVEEQYNEQQKIWHDAQQHNERIDAFAVKKEMLAKKQSEKPHYDEQRKRYESALKAQQLLAFYEQWQKAQKDVSQKESAYQRLLLLEQQQKERLQKATANLEEEKLRDAERKEVEQHVAHLEKSKHLYDDIALLVEEVAHIQKQCMTAENNLQKQRATIEQLQQQGARQQQIADEQYMALQQLPTLYEQQQHLKEMKELLSSVQKLKRAQQQLTVDIAKLTSETNEAVALYEEQKALWLSNQAHILAQSLLPGAPCPVCGSEEHIKLAARVGNVDEVQLQKIEAQAQALQLTLSKRELESASLGERLEELFHKLTIPYTGDEQVALCEKQYEDGLRQIELLRQTEKDLAKLRQQIQENGKLCAQYSAKKEEIEQNARQLKEQLIEKETILSQKRHALPEHLPTIETFDDQLREKSLYLQTLQQALVQAEKQYNEEHLSFIQLQREAEVTKEHCRELANERERVEVNYVEKRLAAQFATDEEFLAACLSTHDTEKLRQSYMTYEKEVHALEQFIKEEEMYVTQLEKKDMPTLAAQLAQSKELCEGARARLAVAKNCQQAATSYQSLLVEIAEKIERYTVEANEVIHLYDTLRGQNAKKISFERYVQIGYLEQITEAANYRLKRLSNGQFELMCSDRQESHGKQSGLSLDVYDSYTGQTRDVKSMSGGEKFNASLCLALGMADVIQNFQGNVQIETMFIDEGFGSLDEETLMRAIDTLIELQKTGRMIGVISHVAELKAIIPAILHVEKLKEGFSRTIISVR